MARKIDPFDIRLSEALDQFVGRGLGKIPTKEVAFQTQISERDLSFFRSRDAEAWKPCSWPKVAKLIKALPSGFAEMLMDECNVTEVVKSRDFVDNPFELMVEMGDDMAAFAKHLSDGQLPPDQVEDMRKRLHALIHMAQGVLNALNEGAELKNVKRTPEGPHAKG